MTIADVAKAISRSIEWEPKAITAGGMHYIRSGRYMITKQADRYQASKRIIWENLGPAMTLAEAKQLCDEDNDK
jgi:hypothetical protein